MKGKTLVLAQIALIIALLYFGNIEKILQNPFLIIIFAAGMILGLWSIYNIGLDTYSPFPEPKKGGKHVQSGAYAYIRHPMYTATMLVTLSILLSNPNFNSFIFFAILIYVLDYTTNHEEEFLKKMYPTYEKYSKQTKKFIPYVY